MQCAADHCAFACDPDTKLGIRHQEGHTRTTHTSIPGGRWPGNRNGSRWWVPGRVEVDDVAPVVSCSVYPAKAVVGEVVPVSAAVWREGHEAVAATGRALPPECVTHLTDGPRAGNSDRATPTTRQAAADPDDERPGALRFPRPVHPHSGQLWAFGWMV